MMFIGLVLSTLPGVPAFGAPPPVPVKNTWQACSDYLTFLVYRYQPPHLSPEERRVWTEWLKQQDTYVALYTNRVSDEVLWDAYSRLPPLVRDRLEAMPANQVAASHYLDDIARQLGLSFLPQTLIANITDRYAHVLTFKFGGKGPKPGEWIRQNLARREKLLSADPTLAAQWQREHAALVEEQRANRWWYEIYSADIPYERLGGNKIRVKIGTAVYEGEVREGETLLWVPAAQVAHPAWNPLSEKNLMNMARDGVPRPDVWITSLGLDGMFYLQDGNHRFALHGNKAVWVKIGFPPRTEPLRIFLDTWGVTQPPYSDILRLYRGEITIWSFLPANAKQKLKLLPESPLPGSAARTARPR